MQFSSAWEKLCWSQHLENGRNFNCNSHDIICITTRCFATRSMRLEIYYLSKKCRKRKVRRRICFDCPLLREFQFSHMLLLNWTAGSKVGKSLSDHHHNLLEVKIDALLGLQLFFSLFSVLPTQKSTRKSAVKLTGSCQPPPRHIYFGGRARGGQRSWKKKKITNFNGQ